MKLKTGNYEFSTLGMGTYERTFGWVIVIMAEFQNYPFEYLWKQFLNMDMVRSKFLSLAIIANLLWFYLSLNRERYDLGMGIILGTILYLPYVLYVNVIQ